MAEPNMQQSGNNRLIRNNLFPLAALSFAAVGVLLLIAYMSSVNCKTGTYTPKAPILQDAELLDEERSADNGSHLVTNSYSVDASIDDVLAFYQEAGAICLHIAESYTCSGAAQPYGDYSMSIQSTSGLDLRFDVTFQWQECSIQRVLGE